MHQEFDPRDLEPAMPARAEASARSKIAPVLIALVALAGFSGVVWYAYVQGVRQSAPPGTTPLIKADTSPAKVRPEQPGGMDVPHQNMQVLNTLPEGDKAAAPPVERLLPPPETPLPRPTDSAAAMSSTAAVSAASSSSALPPKIGPTPTSGPSVAPPVTAPIAAASPAPAVAAAAAPTPPAPVQTASTPAPAAPPAPPAKTQVAAAPAAAPKAAPASGGGFRVQLVSVRAQDQTAQEWARLQRTFPALAALHMSVMRVDLGEKGVWYRIYGGPLSDAAAAGQVCGAIKAKDSKQGCLVVKP